MLFKYHYWFQSMAFNYIEYLEKYTRPLNNTQWYHLKGCINIHHRWIIYWLDDEYWIHDDKIQTFYCSFRFDSLSFSCLEHFRMFTSERKANIFFLNTNSFLPWIYWMYTAFYFYLTAATWYCVCMCFIWYECRPSYVQWIALVQ